AAEPSVLLTVPVVAAGFAVLIGAVTLTGSAIAFAKLQEFVISGRPIGFKGMQVITAALLAFALYAIWAISMNPAAADSSTLFVALVAAALLLGLLLVLPIGGADMPVVIALLNSYSGIAAAAAGFIMGNTALI